MDDKEEEMTEIAFEIDEETWKKIAIWALKRLGYSSIQEFLNVCLKHFRECEDAKDEYASKS